MELTTPNSAATEHADVDNTEPRESDATERATRAHTTIAAPSTPMAEAAGRARPTCSAHLRPRGESTSEVTTLRQRTSEATSMQVSPAPMTPAPASPEPQMTRMQFREPRPRHTENLRMRRNGDSSPPPPEIRHPRPREQERMHEMEFAEVTGSSFREYMVRRHEVQMAEEQRQMEAESEYDMI